MVTGIKCLMCGDVLVSEHRHDFKFCSCGEAFVDGGRDYLRFGGAAEIVEVE